MVPHTSRDLLAYYTARAPIYDAVYRQPERQEDIAFFQRHIPERLAGHRVLKNFPMEAELRALLPAGCKQVDFLPARALLVAGIPAGPGHGRVTGFARNRRFCTSPKIQICFTFWASVVRHPLGVV